MLHNSGINLGACHMHVAYLHAYSMHVSCNIHGFGMFSMHKKLRACNMHTTFSIKIAFQNCSSFELVIDMYVGVVSAYILTLRRF